MAAKMYYVSLRACAIGLIVACTGIIEPAVLAQEAIKPALKSRPDVLDKIKSLKPNEGRILGKAAVVGEFNETAKRYDLHKTGPKGRDFSIRMVWAPERKRALFCGANHGVPHRLNDVWEFDLPSLTWAMLYAPDNARDYLMLGKDHSDVDYKDGIFITKRGGPGIIAHTWWGLTYDPEQRMMLFMNTWVTNQKNAATLLGGDPKDLYQGPPLWAFVPQTAQWKMLRTNPPYPRPIFGGMLEYIPELKGTIWHANNWQMHGTWLYDARKNTWTDLQANGDSKLFESQSPEPEQVSCYDSKRKLVLVQRHKQTFHYDPAKNAWRKTIDAAKDSDNVPYGHDAYAPMDYEPKSGHALLLELKSNAIWAYDPDKTAWSKLSPEGDPMPNGGKRLAYFDPALGVFVVIDGTNVWAYRYQ